MFTVDHEQAKGFEQVKPGEYEVTVVNYELKKLNPKQHDCCGL